MAERIETFKAEHLNDCVHLLKITFNAEPWNDKYTPDTAKKQLNWHQQVPGCVRPDVQRTGVGSRLLNRLEERLGKSGVNTVYLGTNKGTPAEAFYRKHGYEVSDEEIVMSHEW